MITKRNQLLVAAACLLPCVALANDIPVDIENYTAYRVDDPPELDGVLDEWPNVEGIVGEGIVENPGFFIPKGSGDAGELVTHEAHGGGIWDDLADHSCSFQVTYNDEAVYVGIVVTDDYHAGGHAWNGDSIQFHITDGDRAGAFRGLHNMALPATDPVDNENAPIENFTLMNEGSLAGTEMFILRDSDAKTTTYEVRFPLEVVGVDTLEEEVQFGLGFAINDGDEDTPGQKGWSGWGPHSVTFGKSPEETGLVTLGGPANRAPFLITEISLDEGIDSVILTWTSRSTRTYAVDVSDDLTIWSELDDGVSGEEGDFTSFTDEGVPMDATRRYYRVREVD